MQVSLALFLRFNREILQINGYYSFVNYLRIVTSGEVIKLLYCIVLYDLSNSFTQDCYKDSGAIKYDLLRERSTQERSQVF